MKKIINIIQNIKTLKYINLEHKNSKFISFFLKEYQNENLIKFKSYLFNRENLDIFLKNNANIEKINLKFIYNSHENNCLIKNEKTKIKKIFLTHLDGDFYINPSQVEIIKMINYQLNEKSIAIFLDKNNTFNNLKELHLINEILLFHT